MNALERWRSRAYQAAWSARAPGLEQWRGERLKGVRRGFARAVRVSNLRRSASALELLELLANEAAFLEITTDGRRDLRGRGVRLACGWLRDEIEWDLRKAEALLLQGGAS